MCVTLCWLAIPMLCVLGGAAAQTLSDRVADSRRGEHRPITTGLRIFCCGHSFHFYVPAMKSPLGLPPPQELVQSHVPTGEVAALNRLLQQIVWNAVTHHRLSGVQTVSE